MMSDATNNEDITKQDITASASGDDSHTEQGSDSRNRSRFGGNQGGRDRNRGGGSGGRGKGRSKGRRGEEREEKEFEEELLQIDRVTRVVKGGRRLRFRATVAIGDRKGRVGFGVDKATEVPQAIQKAVRDAKKNLIRVPIENGTIPHEVRLKFKSAKILMMPAKPGTGIIAGGSMRKIAELAGIEDLLGKNFGCTNRITTGKAMMMALESLGGVKVEAGEQESKTDSVTSEETVQSETSAA